MSLQANYNSCDTVFHFWNEIYDDIERSIARFFCIDDLKHLFVISKKLNKMMLKLVYNQDNYNQSFDSITILPAIKQAITVQCFPLKKTDQNGKNKAKEKNHQHKQEIIGWVKLIVAKNVTISKWFLNYLINDTKYLICNLLIDKKMSGNTSTRERFAQLIINALKTLQRFEINGIKKVNVILSKNKQLKKTSTNKEEDNYNNYRENKLLSLKFLNLMVSLINEKVPIYWKTMKEFWSIFEEILMFDHEYRYYFVNIELISTLGYFYLQKESPYADEYPDKEEFKMRDINGYTSVIHLINILIRSCHSPATLKQHNKAIQEFENIKVKFNKTEKEKGKPKATTDNDDGCDDDTTELHEKFNEIKNLFKLPKTALGYEKKEYSFDDYKCLSLLTLSDRDKKLPDQKLFWNRMISQSHFDDEILGYMQEMFHHWCFKDKAFSDEIGKLIIEGIDRSDFYRADTFLSMMEKLLSIDDDKFLIYRFNTLFNCDSECIGDNRIDREKMNQRWVNKELKYGTMIDILDLIDYYGDRHQEFVFKCIKKIIECMKNDRKFGTLMIDIRENRWKQWDLFLNQYCSGNSDSVVNQGNCWQQNVFHTNLQFVWDGYCQLIQSFGVQNM